MNILLSHGSPNNAHRHTVEALCGKVAQALGEEVYAAFLGDDLPQGARVLPLFLMHGRHLEKDVPKMMGSADARLITGPAEYPSDMAQIALELAVEQRKKQRAVMFVLYHLGATEALMAELYERSKKFSLPAVAALYGQCDVASVLRLWKEEGIVDVLVQPVLLFPGHSMDTLSGVADASGLEVSTGQVLSAHPQFANWLAAQFREAE